MFNTYPKAVKAIFRIYLSFLIIALLCQCNSDDEVENPIVNIPDQQFLDALIEAGADADKDGIISLNEARAITSLEVNDRNISDLSGIEAFINLEVLFCVLNDLSSLDVSKNISLKHLECSYNNLSSLDITKNTEITDLYCHGNQLTSLDLSKNTALIQFGCDENNLTSLDISINSELGILSCANNQLTTLDIASNYKLWSLSCEDNQLESLDVSNNTDLIELKCGFNKLADLNLSGNNNLHHIFINDMPSLEKVCVWQLPFPTGSVIILETNNSPNIQYTLDCN